MALTKKINNTTVQFTNPQLLELALIGKLCPDKTPYEQADFTGCNLKLLNKLVLDYKAIYSTLVYPLNDVEIPPKYAHIALQLIKDNPELTPEMVDTRNGLLIQIGKERYAHFIKEAWYIVKTDQFRPCILTAAGKIGHSEYEWIMKAYASSVPSFKFYAQFYRGLVKACQGNLAAIQHVLMNIYKNQAGVTKCKVPNGCIIDLDTQAMYQLTIYPSHKIKIPNDDVVVNFVNNKPQVRSGYDIYTSYDYYVTNLTEKAVSLTPNTTTLTLPYDDILYKITTFIGVLYNGSLAEANYVLYHYKGMILFELNGNIYSVYGDDMEQPQIFVNSAHIINYKAGYLYFETFEKVGNYHKRTEYAYQLARGNIEVCAIDYETI